MRPAPDVDQADATLSSLIEEARAMAAPSQRAGESSPRARRGPLAGTLVLDFSGYIAGALGPMFLSQFGATVLKVESLEGDPFRNVGYGFMGWNQNKRSIALDLKSPRGREIACALIKRADVLVENMRSGRTRALGIDYDTVASINPRLVYLTVTAFGSTGPEHDQPGFDPLAQALSGVMAAHGGAGRDDLREAAALSGQPEPIHPLYLTCAIGDYGAAILSALGCVLGLRARQITGLGQHCETSLLHAAMATAGRRICLLSGAPESRKRRARTARDLRAPSRLSMPGWKMDSHFDLQWARLGRLTDHFRRDSADALFPGEAGGPIRRAGARLDRAFFRLSVGDAA